MLRRLDEKKRDFSKFRSVKPSPQFRIQLLDIVSAISPAMRFVAPSHDAINIAASDHCVPVHALDAFHLMNPRRFGTDRSEVFS